MAKNPFHAQTHAAMKAAGKRVNSNIFKRVEPSEPAPHNAPLRAMKSADFTDEANVSFYEKLEEITPSALGRITANKRDELRRKHGLPT
ncbi:hypothetical protein [Bradyrhizobium sp. JYMT SZCCT0428]|uniref:hypothetical protein n=1 Tax=Bradyrhizobium sp. JYMT SZCCT0428 TaxID=2807673 RepID=UPI001BAC7FDE|nr:hypothetical protein [Bradyrhizobium sp. JYMT SZCCT0428]MBR1156579.1 hypothetical protein [Bradyrhizobium sp. JYMT SZCCT0428]